MAEQWRQWRRWLFWVLTFVAVAALFATSIRSRLPIPATIAFAVATGLALGKVSRAERLVVPDRFRRWWIAAVFVVTSAVAAFSVWGPIPDPIGFAGLTGAFYSAIRAIDGARRWGSARLLWVRVVTVASIVFVLLALLPFVWPRLIFGVLCILLASAAIELWSERSPAWIGRSRHLTGSVGAGVLVGMVALLHHFGASWTVAVWLAIALGVVTALLITGNDAPVLVAALLVVALWSALPRDVSLPPGTTPVEAAPYFAVLGDSYTSGEGAGAYFAGTNTKDDSGSQCRRAPTAWPMLLNPVSEHGAGDRLGIPDRLEFAACSGALTADIRRNGHDERSEPEQLERLADVIERTGRDPEFVIVGIGGNDVQFSDVGKTCIAPGNCSDYVDRVREARMAAVGEELVRTYAEIRQLVGGDVPLLVTLYPIPVYEATVDDPATETDESTAPADCRAVLLSNADIVAINGFARALNETIADAAGRAGAVVIDSIAHSLADNALQLCDPHNQPGLNFANLNPQAGRLWDTLNPLNWTHNFIHPNEVGHRAMAAAVLGWMDTNTHLWNGATPAALSDEAADAAGLADPLPDRIGIGPTLRHGIADVVPRALLVLSLATLGWWLLIMALRPAAPAAPQPDTAGADADVDTVDAPLPTSVGPPPTPVPPRAESVLERVVSVLESSTGNRAAGGG